MLPRFSLCSFQYKQSSFFFFQYKIPDFLNAKVDFIISPSPDLSAEQSLRCCSPTCCTGAYNVQSEPVGDQNPPWLNIFRLHASAPLLCNYACNWHTGSYLYHGACCPTAMNLLIGAAAFLGQTVDHRHTQTQIFSFCLPHSQKLPLGKVMCIIRLVASLPPRSKYKHDS